jgi:hypothetical protein
MIAAHCLEYWMKLTRVLFWTLMIILYTSSLLKSQTFDLCIRNKTISGSDLLFDLYMLNTGTSAIYLGHSDFALVFTKSCFTSPTTTIMAAADTLNAYYSLSPAIVSDSIVILNIGQPAFTDQSQFDQRIQRISHEEMGTLIGRIKITGVSSPSHARDIKWISDTAETYHTIVNNLGETSPWLSVDISSNASFSQNVKLFAKVWLEGTFVAGQDSMMTELNPTYLPGKSPYADSASALVGAIPDSTVDYVYLEFRRTLNGATLNGQSAFIGSHSHIFSLDGQGGFWIDLVAGYYYVLVKHRNHLAVMSADSIYLNSTPAYYDFTDSDSKFYGTGGCVELGSGSGVWGMMAGDTNDSGIITVADKAAITAHLNQSGYFAADTNLSGIVTVADKAKIAANLNKASTVPPQY